MADNGRVVRLSDVGALLGRRWRVIAVAVVACVLLAFAAGQVQRPAYTATSVLTVNPVTANPSGGSPPQVNMTTERAVVMSTEVADRAREIMRSPENTEDLIARIGVTSPSDAQVIEIAATAEDPAEAAATANAFADGYLAAREAAVTQEIDQRVDKLDDRIAALTDELPRNPDEAGGPANEAIQNEINSMRESRSTLTGMAVSPGRVITTAAPPREPSSPGVLVFTAGGLAAGTLLGLVFALLRDRFDKRVYSADRLAELVGFPVLGDRGRAEPDELTSRLIMRLDLDYDAPLVTIGVLGADRDSSAVVSRQVTEQLVEGGYGASLVPWGRRPVAQSMHAALDFGRSSGGAKVVVIGASVEDGVARAAMLGQRVDKVVVTTLLSTQVRVVIDLIDELSATDAKIESVVAIEGPVQTRREDDDEGTAPPLARVDEPTRPAFKPVTPRATRTRPAGPGRP